MICLGWNIQNVHWIWVTLKKRNEFPLVFFGAYLNFWLKLLTLLTVTQSICVCVQYISILILILNYKLLIKFKSYTVWQKTGNSVMCGANKTAQQNRSSNTFKRRRGSKKNIIEMPSRQSGFIRQLLGFAFAVAVALNFISSRKSGCCIFQQDPNQLRTNVAK